MALENDDFILSVLKSYENIIINGNNTDLAIISKKLNNIDIATENNYMSDINELTVKYRKREEIICKRFILKVFSTSSMYEIGNELGVYNKEMEMFNNVLPKIAKLLDYDDELIFPRSYKCIYVDMLVLDDLRTDGYNMIDSSEPLGFEHSAIAFKTLAKFHAGSLKLNEVEPNIINNVSKDLIFNNDFMIRAYFRNFDSAIEAMSSIPALTPYAGGLKSLKYTIFEEAKNCIQRSALNVLNHGDFLGKNILFKHDDLDNVIHCKLIDFQLCRWASLAIDIWYFCVVSMNHDTFTDHFNDLVSIYTNSLNDNFHKLRLNRQVTVEEIMQMMDDTAYMGLSVVFGVLPITLKSPETIEAGKHVDSTECNNNPLISNAQQRSVYHNHRWQQAFTNWILYMNDKYFKIPPSSE